MGPWSLPPTPPIKQARTRGQHSPSDECLQGTGERPVLPTEPPCQGGTSGLIHGRLVLKSSLFESQPSPLYGWRGLDGGTEWALEPTGNQLVGPTGTLAHRALGKICPRSADGRPYGTRLRLRHFWVLRPLAESDPGPIGLHNNCGLWPKMGKQSPGEGAGTWGRFV